MSEILRRTLGDHIRLETVLAGRLWPTYVDPAQLTGDATIKRNPATGCSLMK